MHIRAAAIGLLFLCTGCSSGESTEKPAAKPVANCDRPAAKRTRGVVLVYLARTDFSRRAPGDERNFVPVARPIADATTTTQLRVALRELLEGATPSERQAGCISTFDDQKHLLRRVDLVKGVAVVDFHRRAFLDELAIVSASHAGAIFARQIELTVFQFSQVRSLRYELDGDCKAFGDFAQAAKCVPVRRRP